jgi:hypothetical protein
VDGRFGIDPSGFLKLNALVKSPTVARRHALKLGTLAPKRVSRNRWKDRNRRKVHSTSFPGCAEAGMPEREWGNQVPDRTARDCRKWPQATRTCAVLSFFIPSAIACVSACKGACGGKASVPVRSLSWNRGSFPFRGAASVNMSNDWILTIGLAFQRIPYFASRKLRTAGGKHRLSSCQVKTLHRV